MKTRISVSAVLALALLSCAFTCQRKALQSSTGVAVSLKALQDGEIALHDIGKVTDDEHRTLQEGLKTLFRSDKTVRQCIYAVNAPTCVDSGIDAVNVFLSSKVNGLKNQESKQAIELLGQTVIISLNVLKAAL